MMGTVCQLFAPSKSSIVPNLVMIRHGPVDIIDLSQEIYVSELYVFSARPSDVFPLRTNDIYCQPLSQCFFCVFYLLLQVSLVKEENSCNKCGQ